MAVKRKQDVTPKSEEIKDSGLNATVEATSDDLFVEEKKQQKEEAIPLSMVEKMMKQMEEKFNHQLSKL